MNKFNANDYYVFSTGWQGMNYKSLDKKIPVGVFTTRDEALKEINRLRVEELEPDEGAYLYHDGLLEEF